MYVYMYRERDVYYVYLQGRLITTRTRACVYQALRNPDFQFADWPCWPICHLRALAFCAGGLMESLDCQKS